MTRLDPLVEEDVIERPSHLGVLGDGAWFMPRFTAEKYPSLSSVYGVMGEGNRQKLADT
jgi:hypothetical protein